MQAGGFGCSMVWTSRRQWQLRLQLRMHSRHSWVLVSPDSSRSSKTRHSGTLYQHLLPSSRRSKRKHTQPHCHQTAVVQPQGQAGQAPAHPLQRSGLSSQQLHLLKAAQHQQYLRSLSQGGQPASADIVRASSHGAAIPWRPCT